MSESLQEGQSALEGYLLKGRGEQGVKKYLTIILNASAALLEIVMDVCQIGKKVEEHK
ncbi:hypothetical protein [Bartonella schoenbuchensis]|uniref:hypothetical protein n=1 Tax=Bartonella schoenbuchensis TaxID=165694 RepID=UPI003144F28D